MNIFCSVIMTIYRQGMREAIAKESIKSLLENTSYPYELVLVDNTQNNRGLGTARNLAFDMSTGGYIAFVDDDIFYKPGWLEECIKMVDLGDKFIATPVHQPRINKWDLPDVQGYRQNRRTGSNCMVMKRGAFEDIGRFLSCPENPARECWRTGQLFNDSQARKGYTVLVTKEPMAFDMAIGEHSYLYEVHPNI